MPSNCLIEYTRDHAVYDYVFVINGCSAKCASFNEFKVLKDIYRIDSLESIKKILDENFCCNNET